MTPEQERRLQQLITGIAEEPYILEYYGLNWRSPESQLLRRAMERYLGNRASAAVIADDRVTRSALETFLHAHRLIPEPWMAAQLGLDVQSLRTILQRRIDLGLPRDYILYDNLIDQNFEGDLVQSLPALRFRTFGSHSDFCRRLHEALASRGIGINPKYCATSRELAENPPLYSHDIDCITLEALSVKHSLWLDFGKPLNLPPDRCSRLYFVQNRDRLRPFVAGSEPASLEPYEHAAHVAQGA